VRHREQFLLFEQIFASGAPASFNCSDPEVRIQAHDVSQVSNNNQTNLTPHFLYVGPKVAALTPNTFEAALDEAANMGSPMWKHLRRDGSIPVT
jgi:hypothetical protein